MDELPQQVECLAQRVVREFSHAGKTVCTAESCTAGMVAAAIGGVAGASEVLLGGAVTYCDDIKHKVLGVSTATLRSFTAVSWQTAQEMAVGSRKLYGADVAVSLTGYAGPGGGTAQDPAGTVYLGVSSAHGVFSERFFYEGSRNQVRMAATARALELMLAALESL